MNRNGERMLIAVGAFGAGVLIGFFVLRSQPPVPASPAGPLTHTKTLPTPPPATNVPATISSPVVATTPPAAPSPRGRDPAPVSFPHDPSVPLQRQPGEVVRLKRMESLQNLGRASLADAMETQYWAIAGGDMAELARGLMLEGRARTVVEHLLAAAPPALRDEYGSPERFAAFLFAGNQAKTTSVVVDSQRPTGPNETVLRVETYAPDQDRSHQHAEYFRRLDDGTWRQVITDRMALDWATPAYARDLAAKR
jgi:hypothetical protein